MFYCVYDTCYIKEKYHSLIFPLYIEVLRQKLTVFYLYSFILIGFHEVLSLKVNVILFCEMNFKN